MTFLSAGGNSNGVFMMDGSKALDQFFSILFYQGVINSKLCH